MAINYGQGTPDAPSRGYQLYITALVMVLIATLFVIARVSTRISTKRLGMDDYMVIAALISSIFLTATINLAVVHGYGTRSIHLSNRQKRLSLRWFFIAQTLYKLVLGFTKISIVWLYIRIFISKTFQRVCYAVMTAIVIWAIASIFATIFQCVPLAASWDRSVKATCIDKNAFWYGFAVTNTSLDFILLFLPIQPILKLHLHWKEKIGLLGVFALGAFVCVTSIVRTTAVAQTTTGPRKDISWDFISRSIWTLIEANTGIICACLPLLKGPLARLFPRLFNMSTHNSKRYGSEPVNSYALRRHSIHGTSGKQVTNISSAGCKELGQASSWRSSEEYIIKTNECNRRCEGEESGIIMKRDIDISYETEAPSARSIKQGRNRL